MTLTDLACPNLPAKAVGCTFERACRSLPGRLILTLVASMALAWAAVADEPPKADKACAKVGTWLDPKTGKTLAPAPLMAALARRQVVLLGEEHDDAGHHRWQLQMLAALHAHRPDMVVGFEMFPRRVQPALDRWAAGKLGAKAFLDESEWGKVWGSASDLYLPLFHFVRQNRLPMVALNVDRALVAKVGQEGWAAVPSGERAGLSDPAPASDAYLEYLARVFVEKRRMGADRPKEERKEDAPSTKTDPAVVNEEKREEAPPKEMDPDSVKKTDEFKRFVAAQLTWDRAMAEALAKARRERPGSLAIGVLGRGHVQFGHGVPHQLADLGVDDAAVLLPVTPETVCEGLPVDVADAVFVVEPQTHVAPPPGPMLGVMIRTGDDGVRITQIVEGSVAEASGLAAGDVVVSAAGRKIEKTSQLVEIIHRQAPGTWLPLKVRRQDKEVEIVAKFPLKFERPK